MSMAKNVELQMLSILWKHVEKASFPENDSFWIFKIGQVLMNICQRCKKQHGTWF